MLCNLPLQFRPVPKVGRRYTPQIILQLALTRGTARICLIGTLHGSDLARRLERRVVDSLEDLLVEGSSPVRVEGESENHERVGEAIDTETDRTMAKVGLLGLGYRVVISINDAIKVLGDDLSHVVEFLEVVDTLADVRRESDGCEIADCDLIWSRVLNDFRA